ncbi:MAG: glycosyltransferase family 4 protein [Flavobacteriaceae bacterium]|nr:glycosyltransferase family 4 protein [Flavobacteriaceae bacterium]
MKNILYIGNKLNNKHFNPSSAHTLGTLLESEGYNLFYASSKSNKLFRLIDMLKACFKYSAKVDFVLIDTYSTLNFFYAFFTSQLCRLLKLKYIPILHGGNLPMRLDNSSMLSRLIFSNSYQNIAPSNYLTEEFSARGYSTIFIPNVLEIKDYKFLEREIVSPKLLYVRAFSKIYNPELAIKVLDMLLELYPNALLCMVGPEKDESLQVCKSLVKSLKLENHVEFTGVLPKLRWHKKSEDYNIFINTTNFDNTPVSVMEAMALGLPIVSTNVGGMPYLISDKKDGLLVDKNDADEMVNAVKYIIDNQEFARQIAVNARHKVEQFNWEQVKKLWFNVLR